MSEFPQYQSDIFYHSGPDTMKAFFEHLLREQQRITAILQLDTSMYNLTEDEQNLYDAATICPICDEAFTATNPKVHHHCHVTGWFLQPVCNGCNLQLKPKFVTRKLPPVPRADNGVDKSTSKSDDKKKKKKKDSNKCAVNIKTVIDLKRSKADSAKHARTLKSKRPAMKRNKSRAIADAEIVVLFHNLTGYDSHFLIRHFQDFVVAQRDVHNNRILPDISIIPLTSEKFLSFQICGLKFIDSCNLLSASLDSLVQNLMKSGTDKFVHTARHFKRIFADGERPDDDVISGKGHFCYQYMDSYSRFDETKLPSKEHFYSDLSEEKLTDEQYDRATKTFRQLKCRNLREYMEFYMILDCLLLADVWQNFRELSINVYKLDPNHFVSLPSLSWDSLLKKVSNSSSSSPMIQCV